MTLVAKDVPDAWALGEQLGACAVSPVDLVDAALERIAAVDQDLCAFITVCEDEARAAAAIAERELSSGACRGPLHGVPFSVKDVYETAGVRTTAGSRILAGHVSVRTARAVQLLADAGAILIGKANTHEFHAGATNENPFYGQCRNPWDVTRISGGSSGGSGVAVAAGMGAFSLGADTGGSIRIPSALCGLVGLKPSYGRISSEGMIPESWSCDHPGPIARSARDCALLMSLLDEHEPWPLDDFASESAEAFATGVVIGVPPAEALGPLDRDVLAAYRRAIDRLVNAGATAIDVEWPDPERVSDILQVIIWSEAAAFHEEWLQARGDDYSPEVRRKFDGALFWRATDYVRAQRARTKLAGEVARVFERVDIVALPTVPVDAPQPGATVEIDGTSHKIERVLARLTPLANLVGAPAVSVPAGLTSRGLPAGLMLQGAPGDDRRIMVLAHGFERARGHLDLGSDLV